MDNMLQTGLSTDCNTFYSNQHAQFEAISKENKTDDVICLHFGVYGYIGGHMITSSACVSFFLEYLKVHVQ